METGMLAQLLCQAEGEGVSLLTARALVEEASELGAERALARLGLADEGARGDIDELRELLGAWRDAKKSAVRSAIGWIVRGLLALLVFGLALKLGLSARLAA